MGADTLIPQVVAHKMELLLDCPLGDGEKKLSASDAIAQSVVLQILLDDEGDCENPLLACFLLHYGKPIPVAVLHYIGKPEPQNVADTQAQVPFQHKGGGYAFIWLKACKALLHRFYDFGVLLCGEGVGLIIHRFYLQSS